MISLLESGFHHQRFLHHRHHHHYYYYHPYQQQQQQQQRFCQKKEEEEEEEEEVGLVLKEVVYLKMAGDEEDMRQRGIGIAAGCSRGGAGIAQHAVMLAAALQQQMRCYMPAVVDNQQQKFETDPEIRQLVGPAQISFAGLPHAPPAERRTALLQNCTDRQQPHLPIAFTQFGYNSDFSLSSCTVGQEEITFESRFILNGVCVILRGTMNRETMTGTSNLQFDEENAAQEEQRRQQAMQQYGERIQAIRRRFNLPQS